MECRTDLSKLSEGSYEVLFEPHNSKDIAARNFKPNNTASARNSHVDDDRPYSIRSSIDVPDISQESTFTSKRQRPSLQVMDRCSGDYEHERSSSSVFTANSTPQEWSIASNESLFSLQDDHVCFDNGVLMIGEVSLRKPSDFSLSEDVMSDQPSMVAKKETASSAFSRGADEAGPPITNNSERDFKVQKTHDHSTEANARISEAHRGSHKIKAKSHSKPLPSSVIKKPEISSLNSKKRSCFLCSCTSLSGCCLISGSCKMPTFSSSCCSSSLGWSCNWNSCCSCFPKGSCCQISSNSCWSWSCWRIFCCWNWNCCFKGSSGETWSRCLCDNTTWSCCFKWSCCKCGDVPQEHVVAVESVDYREGSCCRTGPRCSTCICFPNMFAGMCASN